MHRRNSRQGQDYGRQNYESRIAGLRWEHLPPAVQKQAILCLTDILATAAGALRLPTGVSMAELVREQFGAGEIRCGFKGAAARRRAPPATTARVWTASIATMASGPPRLTAARGWCRCWWGRGSGRRESARSRAIDRGGHRLRDREPRGIDAARSVRRLSRTPPAPAAGRRP